MLTGETGAGKSILLDAFALALGARGDATLVRQGAEQGQVTAVFDLPRDHPARALLAENDIAAEDELILRRVQFADGRTRAFVNDQPVERAGAARASARRWSKSTASMTTARWSMPATHRRLLDAYGGLEDDAAAVERAVGRAARRARRRWRSHRAEVERAQREADWLRHAVEELRKLAPQAGRGNRARRAPHRDDAGREGRRRSARRPRRGRRHRVAGAGACRRGAPAGAPQAQAPALVEPAVKALDAALNALEEARAISSRRSRAADHDPRELERIEERLFALRAAGRKYNVPVDDLAALARTYAADLALIDAGAERLAALERRRAEAEARYRRRRPRRCRQRARRPPTRSTRRSTPSCKPLKLERAQVLDRDRQRRGSRRARTASTASSSGCRPIPARGPGPLMKVASGGELARFLLALKVVLADRGSAPTLVFDEIDTGVGGAVADAIGVRLARLGDGCRCSRSPMRRRSRRAPTGTTSSPRTRSTRASGSPPASPSLPPSAGARRSRACWPAPRSPTRRAPRPSG